MAAHGHAQNFGIDRGRWQQAPLSKDDGVAVPGSPGERVPLDHIDLDNHPGGRHHPGIGRGIKIGQPRFITGAKGVQSELDCRLKDRELERRTVTFFLSLVWKV